MNANHTAQIAETIETGMSESDREGAIAVLAEALSNQHVLYLKTRNFHWNLKGARFNSLHGFFEEQYGKLEIAIDATAERIRMLGGVAPGSMAEFLGGATLTEAPGAIISGEEAVAALLRDHNAIIRDLRKQIPRCETDFSDAGTADFLTAQLQAHEEVAWMLRSLLE